jgi:hypothetical protein
MDPEMVPSSYAQFLHNLGLKEWDYVYITNCETEFSDWDLVSDSESVAESPFSNGLKSISTRGKDLDAAESGVSCHQKSCNVEVKPRKNILKWKGQHQIQKRQPNDHCSPNAHHKLRFNSDESSNSSFPHLNLDSSIPISLHINPMCRGTTILNGQKPKGPKFIINLDPLMALPSKLPAPQASPYLPNVKSTSIPHI